MIRINIFKFRIILIIAIVLLIFSSLSKKYAQNKAFFEDNKIQFQLGGGWFIDGQSTWGNFRGLPPNTLKAIFPGNIIVSADVFIGGTIYGDTNDGDDATNRYGIIWNNGKNQLSGDWDDIQDALTANSDNTNKTKYCVVQHSLVAEGNAEFGSMFMGNSAVDPEYAVIAHKTANNNTDYALLTGYERDSNNLLNVSITNLNAAADGVVGLRAIEDTAGFLEEKDLLLVSDSGIGIGLDTNEKSLVALEVNGDVEVDSRIVLNSANNARIRRDGSNNLVFNTNKTLDFFDWGDFDYAAQFNSWYDSGDLLKRHYIFNKIGFATESNIDQLFQEDVTKQYVDFIEVQIDGSISIGMATANTALVIPQPNADDIWLTSRIYFSGNEENTDTLWMGRVKEDLLRTVIGDDIGKDDPKPDSLSHPGNPHTETPGLYSNGWYYGGNTNTACHHPTLYPNNDPEYTHAPLGPGEPDHNYWKSYDFHWGSQILVRYRHDDLALSNDQAAWHVMNDAYVARENERDQWELNKGTLETYRDAVVIGWLDNNAWRPSVTILSDGGTLVHQSDFRLKKDLRVLLNTLSRLNKLQGIKFFWKKEIPKAKYKSFGFIAQEVEPLFPALVSQGDKYKFLNYEGFIPIMIQAIKEQHNKIDDIYLKINKLKNKIKAKKQ